MEIKKFAVIDADTDRHIMSVDAYSEKQAIERFSLVQPLVKLDKEPGSFWQLVEEDRTAPSTVPYFMDGFFLVLEAKMAAKH